MLDIRADPGDLLRPFRGDRCSIPHSTVATL